MSEEDRDLFAESSSTLFESQAVGSISTAAITDYATRIRRRGLIPPAFVSVPLSEFTPWSGPLIGEGVFVDFVAWARAFPEGLLSVLVDRIPRSVRFVPLHEACLAVHLWAHPRRDRWLDDAIDIMRAQPLVRQSDMTDLRAAARDVIEDTDPTLPATDDERQLLRGTAVRDAELSGSKRPTKAILENDLTLQAAIVGESRTNTRSLCEPPRSARPMSSRSRSGRCCPNSSDGS